MRDVFHSVDWNQLGIAEQKELRLGGTLTFRKKEVTEKKRKDIVRNMYGDQHKNTKALGSKCSEKAHVLWAWAPTYVAIGRSWNLEEVGPT